MSSVKINAADVGRRDVFLLWPQDIIVGKNSRWQQFDEAHVTFLVSSFEDHGQETEVTIRKVHDDKVQLVAGFNRHEASVRFNAKHPDAPMQLRCRLVNCNEEEAFGKSVTENEGRLGTSPIDKAHAQNQFREKWNWSEDKIKDFYGCSKSLVHLLKCLLGLPYSTQMLVHTGSLSIEAAVLLTDLPAEQQQEVISKVTAPVAEVQATQPEAADGTQAVAPVAEPVKQQTISQRVKSAVREKKIEAGGKQARTMSEVTSFWRHIETDSTLVQALAGLAVQFHDGSITEATYQEMMEALA